MQPRFIIVPVFAFLICFVSACSFKVGTENSGAGSNSNTNSDQPALSGASTNAKNSAESPQSTGLTGTYRYKSGSSNNTINVQEQSDGRLRVLLSASYEHKVNGEWNANVGEAKGVATLKGDTAVLVPEDTEGCEIKMKFSDGKIVVTPNNEIENCGFGLNVSAEGTYSKVSDKPDFGDADEKVPSTQISDDVRIRFAPGKSSTVVSGKISKSEEKVYLVGARGGQTITIEITESGPNNDVVFHLVGPDGSYPMGKAGEMAELDARWSGRLSKTGDYKIILGMIESENASFKMSVAIR